MIENNHIIQIRRLNDYGLVTDVILKRCQENMQLVGMNSLFASLQQYNTFEEAFQIERTEPLGSLDVEFECFLTVLIDREHNWSFDVSNSTELLYCDSCKQLTSRY